jgi:hypothetical protein
MVKTSKYYYLIEELDIDGDKQSDGFLITKYKINKNKDKIFLNSKYVSFKNFNAKLKKITNNKSGGSYNQYNNAPYMNNKPNYDAYMNNNKNINPPHYYNNVPYMNNNEYNKYMNNQHHNPYNNNHNPHVAVAYHQPSVGTAFMEGLGGGLGAGIGLGIMDGLFDMF